MKKLLSRGETGLSLVCAVVVLVGLSCFLVPSSHAQTSQYTLTFNGFPDGSAGLDPRDYIGLDRKLKTNVPGHTLTITPPPGVTTSRSVRLSIEVRGAGLGSSLPNCNRTIATAVTVPFTVSAGGRTLGASDFTGSGIGIQTSDTYQPCIDDISDKITKGVAALPTGLYSVNVTLNDATTGAGLGSGSQVITITAGSIQEAILNLSSPQNGAQLRETDNFAFSFTNSIAGRLLVFEHSNLSQSPDDATRDDNSSLKMVDVQVSANQNPQIDATHALRPWTAGKKYSWYFRGSTSTTGGAADVKKSPIWSFTVVSSNPLLGRLANAIQSAPDPIGSTYTNLVNSGYSLNLDKPFYLQEGDNAAPQQKSVEQILALLSALAQKNVQIKVGVSQ